MYNNHSNYSSYHNQYEVPEYNSDKGYYHHQYKDELYQYPLSHLFYQFIDILHARHFHTEAEKLLAVAHQPDNIENHRIIIQVIKEMRDGLTH
jgi:hypothetical protein